MSNFNLADYETVKSRKERFYNDHIDGRIGVDLITTDYMDYVIIKASVYTNNIDQQNKLPRGEGFALEVRDKELSISNKGLSYETVNYSSWLENCEESAVGRALDNAGYSGNKKCSREEIEKVGRNSTAITSNNQTLASEKQINFLKKLAVGKENTIMEFLATNNLAKVTDSTASQASKLIGLLQ